MAANPPNDLVLTPLSGAGRTLAEWLTTFHLAAVVVDPYTNESSWILDTAARLLTSFQGADIRVAFIATTDADGATAFLGPLSEEFLVFADPDRVAVKGLGLDELPAFVVVRQDGTVAAAAEGWDPTEWRTVTDTIAELTAWSKPTVPGPGDPGPFRGTPAGG